MSLPIAVIDNVDTTTPVTYYVHTDHLSRPILMTDGAKATVWQAEWSPWGAPHSITASPEMNQRFPGQWYQLEAGLHYNWHRHYDPSLGRYTQPDPLGFVDGPSVFAYARNNPQMYVDPDGRNAIVFPPATIPAITTVCAANPAACIAGGVAIGAYICYRAFGGGGSSGDDPNDDDPDRCKKVKSQCISHCDIAIGTPGSDYGNLFQRCLNQCLHDQDCGGTNYGSQGWSTGNPGARTPWRD